MMIMSFIRKPGILWGVKGGGIYNYTDMIDVSWTSGRSDISNAVNVMENVSWEHKEGSFRLGQNVYTTEPDLQRMRKISPKLGRETKASQVERTLELYCCPSSPCLYQNDLSRSASCPSFF